MNTDFKGHGEFEKKYTVIGLQRGRLFKWVTLIVSFYSIYLDLILDRDGTVDILYRHTLVYMHILALVLSLAYIIAYTLLEKNQSNRSSWMAKAVILSDVFLSLLIAAVLSLNSQRFTGNMDVYSMIVLVVAMVIPLYPKWVLKIYGLIHVCFLIVFSSFYQNNTVAVKLFNSTTMVLVALVLFIVLYRSNVKSFLNEEMLKEDKAAFSKLFEMNPFPLMIFQFEGGKIRYANRRAMLFYEIPEEKWSMLHHKDLYVNPSDVDILYSLLETDGMVNDYIAEQRTFTGKTKRPVANYEVIDCFGEKSILIGVADIGEIKRMEHELTIHASTDALTGVLNRRVGMELLRKRHEMAKRENRGFTLCFVDIDNLKMVNDTFGHLEGDSFIRDVCKAVKEEIGPNDMIFRYGGDEFMVLFHEEGGEKTDGTCHRIARRLEALNKGDYKPYPISASMGLFAYTPEMNLELEQMIEMVDKNMYSNKPKKFSPADVK